MADAEVRSASEASDIDVATVPTTTISTISLKSGDCRLVIALLQSREYLQLKVVEVTPELTQLGSTRQEADQLLRAHDEVLSQLQSKQSPVEELLRQADQLISTQRPRAEVYAAMAESLGLAWQDVNKHLEKRKQILDLNLNYQSRAEDCVSKMQALESACRLSTPPVEVDAVKRLLTDLHDLRRAVLESLMMALQEGKALLETLRGVAAAGTLDSRPDRIRTHAEYATSKVEHWLEELHDRRRTLEISFQARKTQLEQCLALALLAIDLRELEDTLAMRREALVGSGDHLGDSSSSAELLLSEHRKLTPEAKDLQDRALKVTKATELIVGSKHYAGDEATAKAYDVLSECAEYIDALEQREHLLDRVIAFFHQAHNTLTKLDQLEVQLTTSEVSTTSSSLAQLHAHASRALEDITEGPLQEGYSLMEAVGRGARGAEGVKRYVEEIENRKIHLEGLCTAHREEHLRISQALTSFLENQNMLFSWLVSVAEAFLQGHQDMGSNLPMAEDFLQVHRQLLAELQTKGAEINALLLTLPPILEYLTDEQRHDVDDKVDNLHSQWVRLKQLMEMRVDLATEYVKFHSLAEKLSSAFDEVEDLLRKSVNSNEQDTISAVEQKWLVIQQMYVQLDNQGKSFIEQAVKTSDPYLDVKRAALCVETLLEQLGSRQLTVTSSYQTWQTTITHEREFKVLWERNLSESRRTVDWVSKLDAQLYPVLTGDPHAQSKVIARQLEDQLNFTLPEVKRALAEIELRIRTAESLAQKGDFTGQDDIENQLLELNSKLQKLFTDYQILLQMLISYFKNLAELERTIEGLQSQYRLTLLPHSIPEVELLVKEHDASRQAILELFKFTRAECQQVVERVRGQEPPACAAHDEERLRKQLELKQEAWEAAWMERKRQLDQHLELCHFDGDLHQINSTLNDLGKQLTDVRGQYGESLASAKATSTAFVNFEKTIEVLETRIQTFVSTAEAMLSSEHVSSPHIERELTQLNNRWAAFRRQVVESRRLINLSIQYFTLIEEAEEWFREGGKLLVLIARKSTAVKRPDEASHLLQDVETFLKPGEARQDERIKKISRLAIELYGDDRSKQFTLVLHENREMVESFTTISEELRILSRNLQLAEERQKMEQVQQDATLAEARAEVAAAKAAASVAEEARLAAEAMAQSLRDAIPPQHKTVDVGVEALPPAHVEMQTSTSPPPRDPTPVEELPKYVPPVFVIPLYDSNIQEGERFTFECCVTGFPTPDIIWYKDGISIQNNPDYMTTYVDGRCTLAIEETFTEDSAKFTCTAGNIAGIAETSAMLSVNEAELEEVFTPPEFSKPLQPSMAREGSSFQLEVKVEGHPLPTVQWFKDGACIDTSPDYSISYNNGVGIVHFDEVFLEDQAEYTCRAVNQMGTATSMANLTVQPLEAPKFLMPLSNVMARAGQKVKLECVVTGLPTPELTWTHNDEAIGETRDIATFYDNRTASLVIAEGFPKDAGVYAVTARNLAGEATCSCNVTVKGRLPTETSDSELASDLEPIKPSVQLQLKDLSVFEGKKVQLDCIIVGLPEPEVIWYHDERPVKESPEFQLLFQGDRCSLIINEVYLEDAGEYKVVAINSAGEASSKCHLTVQSISQAEPAMRPTAAPAFDEAPKGTAPKFSKLLSDVLVAEGDQVTFECCVSGDPRPDIRWFLNNQEIQPRGKVEFGEDAEGTVTLTISETHPDNKGVYTVKASNPFGEAKCFATLIVKASTTTSPPAFLELFADRNVFENETTKFECIVTGKPQPKVQWCFNDKPVSGPGFLVSVSGDRQVMTITQVTPDRVGKISCVAQNEAGKASCVAVLKIMQDATDDRLVPIESNTFTEQIGSSSFTMKKSVVVQSSSSHVSSSTTTFGAAEPNVQVHSYTSDSVGSMQQVGNKPPVQIQTVRTHEIHQVNQDKPEVHSQTITKITNGEQVQEVSVVPVKSSPKPKRKSIAPRFMSPLNGKIVDQGSDVIFEGIVDGYPTPEVTWTKNGRPLTSDGDKVTISWAHNKVRLELRNAAVPDAGRYTCKAENEVGTASSTADLVVKKTIFPPVFGRRLQAQMVKVGERLNVEVEVTGTPEPTVTWYKDGEQILAGEAPGGKFRTKVQGNCYLLIIEKATLDHCGKYMVRAVNEGGEAQSIADFLVYEPEPDTTVHVVKHLVFEDVTHHTTQQRVAHAGSRTETPPLQPPHIEMPSLPATIALPAVRRSPSPFTQESLNIIESTKTKKHVTIRVDRTPSPTPPPMMRKSPTPVQPESVEASPVPTPPPIKEEPKTQAPRTPTPSPIREEPKTEAPRTPTPPPIREEPKTEVPRTPTPPPTREEPKVEIPRTPTPPPIREEPRVETPTSTPLLEIVELPVSTPTFIEREVVISTTTTTLPVQIDQKVVQISLSPTPIQEETRVVEISFSPTPVKEKPKIVDIPVMREEKTSSPEPVLKPSEPEIVKTEVNEGIETGSISKQTAFDFFFAKLHENDNKPEHLERPVKHKIFERPTPLHLKESESPIISTVHKREHSSSSSFDIINQQPQFGTSVFDIQPAQIVSESYTSQQTSSFIGMSQNIVSSSFVDEFNLQPEPPPEMGYISKSDVPQMFKEDVTTRVKKLEEVTRVLSPVEVPSGAVRIFPVKLEPLNQEAVKAAQTPTVVWPPKQEVQEEVCVKEEIGKKKVYMTGITEGTIPQNKVNYRDKPSAKETEDFIESMIEPKIVESPTHEKQPEPIISPAPLLRPQADILQRPTSPRPSAEGISMEKLWASRRTPEPELVVAEPPKSSEIWRASSPKPAIQTFSTDNIWSSSFTSSQSLSSSYTEEVKRSTSPRPSAEGVTMEKLWIPQKPTEPEPTFAQLPTKLHVDKDKPSTEGLKMDKIWAHKHKSSVLKKTWPPQQDTEEKPVLMWASKPSDQAMYEPKVTSEVHISHQKVTEKVQKEEIPQMPKPAPFLPQVPQQAPVLPQVPKPAPVLPQVPQQAPVLPQVPKPAPVLPQVLQQAPVLPQVPKPAPVLPQVLQQAPVLPQVPKPAPVIPQVPKPAPVSPQMVKPAPISPQMAKPAPVLPQVPIQVPVFKTFQHPPEIVSQYSTNITSEFSTKHVQSVFEPPKVPDISPPKIPEVPPQPTQYYIAEARVSNTISLPEPEMFTNESTTTSQFQEFKSTSFEKKEFFSSSSQIEHSEDRNIKPSEAKKIWPPIQKEESAFKPVVPSKERILYQEPRYSPISTDELFEPEPFLEPGTPPEFAIAEAPVERRMSHKETVEQELAKDLKKEPSRHLPGSVRILPPPKDQAPPTPPLPRKEMSVTAPPLPAKQAVPKPILKPIPKKEVKPLDVKFERFPDLEPFPYKPNEPTSKPTKGPPPPKPSKFRKGEFATSEYDSDLESTVIPAKWRPSESDSEEVGYRKVRPPSVNKQIRPPSTEPEPLPPSKFDNPPNFEGPPRPAIDKVQAKKEISSSSVKKVAKVETKVEKKKHHREEKRKISPPNLKPGSPPEFVQAVGPPKAELKISEPLVKTTPESPKKVKPQESGYMADTDEPRSLVKQTSHKFGKYEETSVRTTTFEHSSHVNESISHSTMKQVEGTKATSAPAKSHSVTKTHHRHQEAKKSVTSQPVPKVLQPSAPAPKVEPSLEPFPFTVSPALPKRPLGPPPPSPSKFMKGEFRESDYESDYDGRIPPRWCPDGSDIDALTFKPVHPVLTPSRQSRTSAGGRTPTPPTEFDDPPQIGGPPRPKFEPIEKQPTVKLQEILKPSNKQQKVFKPKPVTAQNLPPMEVIIATPAVKEVLGIKPGSPPELAFAPRRTDFQNATSTETSNVVNFAESTEHSRRVVSVQQTTRIIKFGEKENKNVKLDPFPFKPEPVIPKGRPGPPVTMPKRFVPGEFRESDYESEIENIHIKPKWEPGQAARDDLHYRKVRPPTMTRSASVPVKGETRVPTPMEFDTTPPVFTTIESATEYEAEQRRLRRMEDMRKRFGEKKTKSEHDIIPSATIVTPAKIPAAASYAATKHMNQMTSTFKSKAQQFVNDIITDVEVSRSQEKPVPTAEPYHTNGADEPQAYREESRVAEYGTKHIDPDTGLIYFKYDFGYEFGVVLPGEGKKAVEGDKTKKRPRVERTKQPGDIEVPIIHEKTSKKIPQFRPKKLTHVKAVKWEPASESEMSECEDGMQHKKRYSLPQASSGSMHIHIPAATPSPMSLSPSLPSLSPYCSSIGQQSNTPLDSTGPSPWTGVGRGVQSKGRGSTPTPPSTPSTSRSTPNLVISSGQPQQPKKAPFFITPLRDIAVVSGQAARFECIVQAEPQPNVLWSKDGRILVNSSEYVIEFRNGVCRLTIPQAYIDSAGAYTCTATNLLGTTDTTANLQVPGERRFKK